MPYLIGFVVALIAGSGAVLAWQAYRKRKSPTASRRQLDLAMIQLSHEIQRNPISPFIPSRSSCSRNSSCRRTYRRCASFTTTRGKCALT